jgi:hypothetical protein
MNSNRIIKVKQISLAAYNSLLQHGFTVEFLPLSEPASPYANYKYKRPLQDAHNKNKPSEKSAEIEVCHKPHVLGNEEK